MSKVIQFFIILFSISFLTACGGGGSSSGTTDTSIDVDTTDISTADLTRPRIYLYKTGKIIYDIKTDITLAPVLKTTVRGTKRFVFKDWGNIRVEETMTTTTEVYTNQSTGVVTTKVTDEHELRKWDTPKSYTVLFEDEKIRVLDFSPVLNLLSEDSLVDAIAPDQVEPLSVEGVKVVALTPCTVLRVNEIFTVCEHSGGIDTSGITLESTFISNTESSSIVGIDTATLAVFDLPLPDFEFELPDYELE